jgi:hypothetical protein
MLFDADGRVFESYKERNLYYKFFAGYFFNELIPGYEGRLKSFAEMIVIGLKVRRSTDQEEIVLSPISTRVSFDNHVVQFEERKKKRSLRVDRGEFADVLIRDLKNNVLIAIEVKYRSRVVREKDFIRNWIRIKQANKHFKAKSVVQCLLVPARSVIDLSPESLGHPLIFLTWEQFLRQSETPAVRKWLRRQLKELD